MVKNILCIYWYLLLFKEIVFYKDIYIKKEKDIIFKKYKYRNKRDKFGC